MNFLNVILLGGTAAFLAPLLIHLLHRSRYQVQAWGAMHLLDAAEAINSKRTEWQQWLLLLLRCLIPILLAFGLARPVLTSFQVAGSDRPQQTIIVLDNSRSMDVVSATGETYLEIAKRTAKELIEKLPSEQVEVIPLVMQVSTSTARGSETQVQSLDLFGAGADPTAQVDAVQVRSGKPSPLETLRTILQSPTANSDFGRRVYLLSDFQASGWAELSTTQPGVTEQSEPATSLNPLQQLVADAPAATSISLLPSVSGKESARAMSKSQSNLALSWARPVEAQVVVGQPIRIAVAVRSFDSVLAPSAAAVQSVVVQLLVDGVAVEQRLLELDGSESSSNPGQPLEFAFKLSDPGWHAIQVQVREQESDDGFTRDALPTDDHVYAAVEVTRPIRVGILQSADKTNDPSSDYLAVALAPFTANDAVANRFFVTRLSDEAVTTERLSSLDILVLSDLPRTTRAVAESIEQFVAGGGGLVLFVGPAVDPQWYNKTWGPGQLLAQERNAEQPSTSGNGNLLPAWFANASSIAGESEKDSLGLRWASASEQLGRTTTALDDQSLAEVAISSWLGFEFVDANRKPLTLLQLTNGNAMAIVADFGQGRVVQTTLAADDQWSNWPTQTAFLPLVQLLANQSRPQATRQASLLAGETLRPPPLPPVPSDESPATMSAPPVGTVFPIGAKESAQELRLWTDFDTGQPGLYEFRFDPNDPSRSPSRLLAVNERPGESDLRRLTDEELEQLARQIGSDLHSNVDEAVAAYHVRRDGKEVWPWIVLGVVAVLFAELILSTMLSRGGS